MKLKLNRTLRAALVAAITAVGFTLSQAQAATADVTLANVMNQKADTPIIWGENGLDLTSVTASCTTEGVKDNTDYTRSIRAVDTNVGTGNSYTYTLKFTTATDLSEAVTLSAINVDFVTYNGNGVGHPQEDSAADGPNRIKCVWTLTGTDGGTIADFALHSNGHANQSTSVYTKKDDSYTTNSFTGGTAKIAFDDITLESNKEYTLTLAVSKAGGANGFFVGIGNVALVQSVEVTTSTWNGTAYNNKWSEDASWTGGVPTAISPVVFDSGAQNKTVDVDTTATADSIAVNASGYEFQLNNNLTTRTLDIATDASLSLTGSGTMEISGAASIAAGGSMSVGAGATLKLDDGATAAQLLQMVTGDGNITLSTNVDLEGAGSKAAAPTSKVTGTLTLDHSTLKLGKMSTSGAFADMYVDLSSFSHVKLDNATLWVHAAPMTINGVTVESGTSNIHIQDTSSKDKLYLTLAGTTSVAANSTLKFVGAWKGQTSIQTLAGEGTLDLAGPGGNSIYNIGGGSIGKLQISTNVVSNVTGDLTVGGLDGTQGTVNVSDGKNLTFDVAEGGTHSFTGTLTVGGQIVKKGVGSQAISGTALHRMIDAQAGTLVLNGDFAIDAITDASTVSKTVDYEDKDSVNGFHMSSGTITVYTGDGTLNLDNGHFKYANTDVTAAVQEGNGVYTLSGISDKTAVYVNEGSLDIAKYKEAADAASVSITRVELKDDTTVNVDAAITTAVKLVDNASATVNATAATTISSITGPVAGKTLTIGGNSVVTLQNGSDFAGNVAVTGGTVKLGNQTALGAPNTTGTKTITVGAGATIDVNGQGDAKYIYTLAGGTLTNMGGAIGHNMAQTSGLILTDDSYIGSDGSNEMWVLASTYAANTVNLNNNKLTKKGNSTFGFSNSTISAGTLQVDGGTLQFQDEGEGKHGSVAADIVLNGGTVAGTLNQSGNISVTTKENATTGATINVGNNTLTLSTDEGKTLTLTGGINVGDTGSVNVTGTGTLLVDSTLNLGGKLTAAGNIEVGEHGNLTLTAGSTVYQTIDNAGTVSLTGVTLGGGFSEQSGGTGYYDLAGNKTTSDANHYEGTGSTYVQVVSGGTATGSDIQWKGQGYNLENDGTIIVGGGSPTYDTFFVVDEIDASTIAAGAHYGDTQTIDVGDGASLNMDDVLEGKNIVTHVYSYITGDNVSPEAISLAAGSSTFFLNDITTVDGITFTGSVAGVFMVNTTAEGDPVKYSTSEESIAVSAEVMTSNSDTDVTVANNVDAVSIENVGTGALILTNVYLGENASLTSIAATTGDITLQNVGVNPVELADLTIGAGTTVAVYQGDELAPNNEGTITITDTLTGGSATLLANLTLKGGSTLDVDGGHVAGGAMNALTLGSTLRFDLAPNSLVNLDQDTIEALAGLSEGQWLDLIVAADGTQLGYVGAETGMSYDQLFRAEGLTGPYTVYANEGSFGLVKGSQVPEPTTGTLSLLALAALAARRRRK